MIKPEETADETADETIEVSQRRLRELLIQIGQIEQDLDRQSQESQALSEKVRPVIAGAQGKLSLSEEWEMKLSTRLIKRM